ncbi:MAG: multiheme c-type cytochrome, partial [Ferruginibacter sp.]
MRHFLKYRFSLTVILVIILSMFFFIKCTNNENNKTDISGPVNYADFAGSASCMNCHKNIYDAHINTAHFKTSGPATDTNIRGSFKAGENTFDYNNGGKVSMEKRADGYYQVAYINNIEKKSERFDMIIGSGTKGQSFASWTGNYLFQLPITYFTSATQWCNSPGYPNKIAFNRPITSRCLECHSTYAEKTAAPETGHEAFDKGTLIMGVTCEKCHGPAAKHVSFQTQNPTEKKAKFIINPALFSRQQSLDLCALCHG